MTLAEWRDISAKWRGHGFTKLADDLDALIARMERVEEWALHNVEGDGLRRVLWPKKVR